MRTETNRLLVLATVFFVCLGPGLSAADQPTKKPAAGPAMGELKIEGKCIERLTLERKRETRVFDPNDTIVLNRPGPRVSLPAGTYCVKRIELEGGYISLPPMAIVVEGVRYENSFVLTADKPHVLKIGAPLNPTVLADRQGSRIRWAYRLVDAEWREYSKDPDQERATFTIYQGDRIVGSGRFESFEYG